MKGKKIQKNNKLNDGLMTDIKQVISNRFNDFFVNIGRHLLKRLHKYEIILLVLWVPELSNQLF